MLRCKITPSAGAATEGRIALPDSLTSASSSIIPSLQIIGQMEVGSIGAIGQTVGSSYGVYIEPSVGYVTFGGRSSGATGLVKQTATNISTTTTFSFYATIPISGWQDYGVIVGSFAGIEKCANDYECTDTFSAQVSATGVVSNENIDWISGNCTVASTVYTCPFNANLKDGTSALTVTPNCTVSAVDSGTGVSHVRPATSNTQVVFENFLSTNGGVSSGSAVIKCQKGSSDYKPKTAKVASSIGVPTVPGLAGTGLAVDTSSISFGATSSTACSAASTTCAYNDAVGSTSAASVKRGASGGSYTIESSKTYAKLKCQFAGFIPAVGPAVLSGNSTIGCSATASCAFTTVRPDLATATDSFGTISCIGTY
jgi:hypothetical protein